MHLIVFSIIGKKLSQEHQHWRARTSGNLESGITSNYGIAFIKANLNVQWVSQVKILKEKHLCFCVG